LAAYIPTLTHRELRGFVNWLEGRRP